LRSYRRSLEFTERAEKILLAAPDHALRGVTTDLAAASYALAYFGFWRPQLDRRK